jgi:hypothetical protein
MHPVRRKSIRSKIAFIPRDYPGRCNIIGEANRDYITNLAEWCANALQKGRSSCIIVINSELDLKGGCRRIGDRVIDFPGGVDPETRPKFCIDLRKLS